MASAVGQQAIDAAHETRRELGLPLDEPLGDLLTAVEDDLGLPVVLLALPQGWAGAYLKRKGRGYAFVNGTHAAVRQRFTLGHELGHHRLGHDSRLDDWANLVDYEHDPVEVQANYFAAEFLVPRPAVEAWCERHLHGEVTLETVVRVAAHFAISGPAARVRLQSAGILTDEARNARLKGEIDQQLHLPLAGLLGLGDHRDALAVAAEHLPRLPATERTNALTAYAGGEIDLARLAALLGQRPAELARAVDGLGFAPAPAP
jgi:Zn-dependent peptidase ImmA (M78 family)